MPHHAYRGSGEGCGVGLGWGVPMPLHRAARCAARLCGFLQPLLRGGRLGCLAANLLHHLGHFCHAVTLAPLWIGEPSSRRLQRLQSLQCPLRVRQGSVFL